MARPPDIILVDYHLDNENGLDLIRTLRRSLGPRVPAVLVTADRSTELRAAAEKLDVLVINKPVKPAALRTMLTRYHRMLTAAE
jgi:CheY-like chemotaxis protein